METIATRSHSMAPECPKLNHEMLDSYQVSIEFLAIAVEVLNKFPKGYHSTSDQLQRASLSIPLNIAEGYGKRTKRDRARSYDIARGSAHECGAIFDSLRIVQLIDLPSYIRGKTLLHRIVSMLVKMCS
jgi:four helix bundle protein